VVGIPGKVVGPKRVTPTRGIDLDHHIIPDPVADAVNCLLERIGRLERQVGMHDALLADARPAPGCDECDANQVCETAGEGERR
jgi:serine O-acetyltransferase